MKILIKNTRLIDGDKEINGDIYLKGGYIENIGENLKYDCYTIDGSGLYVMPSFIDMHVHFRDPGAVHKEDLITGSLAALKGGYTYTNLMYESKDDWSISQTLDYIYNKNEQLDLINLHQSIFIGRHNCEDTLEILNNVDSRVKIVVVERSAYISNSIFLKAVSLCKEKNIVLIVQAEDRELQKDNPRLSEELETIRCGLLAKNSKSSIHFTHISSKEAVKALRQLKEGCNNITCDITPHHLALNDTKYKVNPPLKEKEDTDIFIEAIRDGIIDTIATDHAPQTIEDLNKGLTGAVGLETAFSVCYTALVIKHKIKLSKLSSLMSGKPSEILNLNQGYLRKGYKADIVLVDLKKTGIIDSSKSLSKCNNTPFFNYKYFGEVLMTIKDGKIKYSNQCLQESHVI